MDTKVYLLWLEDLLVVQKVKQVKLVYWSKRNYLCKFMSETYFIFNRIGN